MEPRAAGTPDKTTKATIAEVALSPALRSFAASELFVKGTFGEQDQNESVKAVAGKLKAAKTGDLAECRAMLAGQALTLDAIFTEMARRSGRNMGEYLGAMETYMRLALKAQAQSRATIETLDRLVTGREQTVRHVHVNQGGQAVISDQFHHHIGGQENGKSSEQPQTTRAAGASPPLSSPDPIRSAVPVASGEGPEPLQDARRQGQRRA